MNYRLENQITSLRLVTILVLFYIISYAFKLTFLLLDVLTNVITESLPRLISSCLMAITIAFSLLVVSIHVKNKMIPYLISVLDAFMLLFLFHAYTTVGETKFKAIFLSVLIALIGFLLVSVFVNKYGQLQNEIAKTNNEKLQNYNELQKKANELKENIKELERKKTESLRFFCEDCETPFSSQNAKNRHKCKPIKE